MRAKALSLGVKRFLGIYHDILDEERTLVLGITICRVWGAELGGNRALEMPSQYEYS